MKKIIVAYQYNLSLQQYIESDFLNSLNLDNTNNSYVKITTFFELATYLFPVCLLNK